MAILGAWRQLSSHPQISPDPAGKVLMTRLARFAAALFPLVSLLANCTTTSPPAGAAPATADAGSRDTPRTTTEGNAFVAPAGWSIAVRGPATIVAPPEGDGAIALVDVHAPSADSA